MTRPVDGATCREDGHCGRSVRLRPAQGDARTVAGAEANPVLESVPAVARAAGRRAVQAARTGRTRFALAFGRFGARRRTGCGRTGEETLPEEGRPPGRRTDIRPATRRQQRSAKHRGESRRAIAGVAGGHFRRCDGRRDRQKTIDETSPVRRARRAIGRGGRNADGRPLQHRCVGRCSTDSWCRVNRYFGRFGGRGGQRTTDEQGHDSNRSHHRLPCDSDVSVASAVAAARPREFGEPAESREERWVAKPEQFAGFAPLASGRWGRRPL